MGDGVQPRAPLRAPTLSLLVSPPPWPGSQLSSSPPFPPRDLDFPALPNTRRGQAGPGAPASPSEAHTPAPRPHSSRQGESRRAGRASPSSSQRLTGTQTMIPPPHPLAYSPVGSLGPRHPRGSPRRDPIVAQAAGRPGADPRRLRRLRLHLSKLAPLSRGDSLGAGSPPRSPQPTLAAVGSGQGPRGLGALFVSQFSPQGCLGAR